MKFENTQVMNFESALRGMRNPKNSWDKSDSFYGCSNGSNHHEEYTPCDECLYSVECNNFKNNYVIGGNDTRLAQTLIRAGSEHRKFMRQIFVCVDITAPLYWWKEFDTYKVGTTANSTSTMHKITSSPITIDCFEIDDYIDCLLLSETKLDINIGTKIKSLINDLEQLRKMHLYYITKSKQKYYTESERKSFENIAEKYWKELIRWLPESWLQKRTVTLNYENLFAMCSKGQRRNHKLNEWSGKNDFLLPNFISWARTLPYAKEFIFIDELDKKEK